MNLLPCKPARMAVYVFALLGMATSVASAENLEQTLHKQAPKILKQLQEKGCKNVGVLKFRVKKGNEPTSDNVGTLNMTLADRLEIALALANDNDPAKQIGIIQQASAVAAKIKESNHLTKPGRAALFKEEYPLAWGNQAVLPDTFLMGAAKVSPDLQEMTINVMSFDSNSEPAQVVPPFTVAMDTQLLSELGESFSLRSIFAEATGQKAIEKAIASAAQISRKEEDNPIAAKGSPVGLDLFYDGKLVPFEIKNGRAFVPEPRTQQKVAIALKRKDAGSDRYGVVLKVNGESVLFKEKFPDAQCQKIVLGPGKPITVRGFHTSDKTVREFSVLSRAASKQNEIYYGADVGTITMQVYPELKGQYVPPAYTDEGEDIAAIHRGTYPVDRPQNLAALKGQLRRAATQESIRGLIVEGKETAGSVQRTDFRAAANPVMALTITYYKP